MFEKVRELDSGLITASSEELEKILTVQDVVDYIEANQK